MIYVFYFFSAALVFLSYKSLRGGFAYLAYFKKELAKPESEYAPFVSVIAPCRGVDSGMKENLEKLFEQDFPVYEIIFVVDDETDEAVEIIKKFHAKAQRAQSQNSSLREKPKMKGRRFTICAKRFCRFPKNRKFSCLLIPMRDRIKIG